MSLRVHMQRFRKEGARLLARDSVLNCIRLRVWHCVRDSASATASGMRTFRQLPPCRLTGVLAASYAEPRVAATGAAPEQVQRAQRACASPAGACISHVPSGGWSGERSRGRTGSDAQSRRRG